MLPMPIQNYHIIVIVYNTNGGFNYNKNTQGINTPVLVYTLGNPRTIYFRKRQVIKKQSSKSCWENDKHPSKEFILSNNSLFLLHPDDEKPKIRHNSEGLSQFQHGNAHVKEGDISIGIVFRHCTKHSLMIILLLKGLLMILLLNITKNILHTWILHIPNSMNTYQVGVFCFHNMLIQNWQHGGGTNPY